MILAILPNEVRESVFKVLPLSASNKIITDHDEIVQYKEDIWKSFLKKKGIEIDTFSSGNGDLSIFSKQAKDYRNYMIEYLNGKLNECYNNKPIITFNEKQIEDWTKNRITSTFV